MQFHNTVIFDHDGTIVDSIPYAWTATREIFVQCGVKPPRFEEYISTLAPPYNKWYRDRGVVLEEEEIWRRYFPLARHHEAMVFDDVADVLRELRRMGVMTGIVSAQRQAVVHELYRRFRIIDLFDIIETEVNDKSETLNECFRNRSKKRGLYVGDLGDDMRSSKAAGIRAVGITRGNGLGHVLKRAGADHVIDVLRELIPIVKMAKHNRPIES